MASVASTVLAPGGSWWLLVAPGGSWWLLLVAPLAPGGYCGFRSSWWLLVASVASMASMALGSYSSSLLWLIYHLSESINQSISETCSPGACCALDTPWVSSIHPSIHPPSQPASHPSLYFYISISIYIHLDLYLYLYLYIYLSSYLFCSIHIYIYIISISTPTSTSISISISISIYKVCIISEMKFKPQASPEPSQNIQYTNII